MNEKEIVKRIAIEKNKSILATAELFRKRIIKVKKALALADSMILSGEDHTEESIAIVQQGLNA